MQNSPPPPSKDEKNVDIDIFLLKMTEFYELKKKENENNETK